MIYDVAIVGTGPAGLAAALTLKLHNKEIIWFGSAELSDKVGKSEKIPCGSKIRILVGNMSKILIGISL